MAPAVPGVWVGPVGPVAVLALAAVAWLGPEDQRPQVLTLAALVGAGLAATRQPAAAPDRPARLSDDELRAAIAAW